MERVLSGGYPEVLERASWGIGNEVDIVIEDSRGHLVGIEVKAAATVTQADFSGLRKLAEASGKRFTLGLVLYDHDTIVTFGERLYAAPISSLWK